MRSDQIRFLSIIIVTGLLCAWWNVFEAIESARSVLHGHETALMKGRPIPTADATYIMLDFRNQRLFLDLWRGLVLSAAAAVIVLAWISRTWSLATLAIAALAVQAGFLTFFGATMQLAHAFGPDLVSAEYISRLRGDLDRSLAAESFEWGLYAIAWLVDLIFVRVPFFVALVAFPLVSLFELAHQWRVARRSKGSPGLPVEPFEAA